MVTVELINVDDNNAEIRCKQVTANEYDHHRAERAGNTKDDSEYKQIYV